MDCRSATYGLIKKDGVPTVTAGVLQVNSRCEALCAAALRAKEEIYRLRQELEQAKAQRPTLTSPELPMYGQHHLAAGPTSEDKQVRGYMSLWAVH